MYHRDPRYGVCFDIVSRMPIRQVLVLALTRGPLAIYQGLMLFNASARNQEGNYSNGGTNLCRKTKFKRFVDSNSAMFLIGLFVAWQLSVASGLCIDEAGENPGPMTAKAGTTANIQFNLPRQVNKPLGILPPFFTIRLCQSECPFYDVGSIRIDPNCTTSPGQQHRFKVSMTADSLSVNLIIHNVTAQDADVYILTLIRPDATTVKIAREMKVVIPHGRAQCFMFTRRELGNDIREVHCRATLGNTNASLSCFQEGRMMLHKDEVHEDVGHIRGVFWMYTNSRVSCCSHNAGEFVTAETCHQYVWPPHPNAIQVSTATDSGEEYHDMSATTDQHHADKYQASSANPTTHAFSCPWVYIFTLLSMVYSVH